MKLDIEYKPFSLISLEDNFFDSLKTDYPNFTKWFNKKRNSNAKAFVFYNEDKTLNAFLYLKIEKEPILDIEPSMITKKRRIKIGTFKIDARQTKLSERFVKTIFNITINSNIQEIYVTIFAKHRGLINILTKYGFSKYGYKKTSAGKEEVFVKNFIDIKGDILLDFPLIDTKKSNKFLLSIYPKYHTQLFSDSILSNENYDSLKDVSHTNSIHKIYICNMKGVLDIKTGDHLIIYRTSDNKGPARYRSVATSICVVEEISNINNFNSLDDFLNYISPYSIFTKKELTSFYATKRYPYIIKMLYNISFNKKVTNGDLIDYVGLNSNDYWGVRQLNDEQFYNIFKMGEVNESFIINKT